MHEFHKMKLINHTCLS